MYGDYQNCHCHFRSETGMLHFQSVVGTSLGTFFVRRDRGPKTQLFSKSRDFATKSFRRNRNLEKSCVLGPLSRRDKKCLCTVPTRRGTFAEKCIINHARNQRSQSQSRSSINAHNHNHAHQSTLTIINHAHQSQSQSSITHTITLTSSCPLSCHCTFRAKNCSNVDFQEMYVYASVEKKTHSAVRQGTSIVDSEQPSQTFVTT
jgi:hypothetical protein